MKSTKFYPLLVGVLVLLNVLTLYVLWPAAEREDPHRPPRKSLVLVLHLEGKAKTAVAQLEKAHFHVKDSLVDRSRDLHEELFRNFSDATKDSADIAGLIDRIVENQRITEQMTFDYFKSVAQWCTPEQRRELQHAIHRVLRNAGGPPPRRSAR